MSLDLKDQGSTSFNSISGNELLSEAEQELSDDQTGHETETQSPSPARCEADPPPFLTVNDLGSPLAPVVAPDPTHDRFGWGAGHAHWTARADRGGCRGGRRGAGSRCFAEASDILRYRMVFRQL